MEKQFDFRSMVGKYAELPLERLHVITDFSQLDVAQIRRGIVFVFAPWSGPAVWALRQLTRLLTTIELGSLAVIILDHDCMTDKDMVRVFGHGFYGEGEALWIRDGQVIAESSKQPDAIILEYTKQLLGDEPQQAPQS